MAGMYRHPCNEVGTHGAHIMREDDDDTDRLPLATTGFFEEKIAGP